MMWEMMRKDSKHASALAFGNCLSLEALHLRGAGINSKDHQS